jgi:hypothetical protein
LHAGGAAPAVENTVPNPGRPFAWQQLTKGSLLMRRLLRVGMWGGPRRLDADPLRLPDPASASGPGPRRLSADSQKAWR